MKMKLCYVEPPFAYFTSQALSRQWGDDWNDAPYEHNAGFPYNSEDGSWRITKVAFDAPLVTPSCNEINSKFSVQDINRRAVPWLQTDKLYSHNSDRLRVMVFAGVSLDEFCKLIRAAGGAVYTECTA